MIHSVKLLACLLFLFVLHSTLGAQCTASFTYSSSGNTINVTSTGSGGTPQWDFGDGTTGYGATATHNYSVPGTYTVCVIMLNFFGGICDSACSVVTVGGIISVCNANFGYSVSGGVVSFNNLSTASYPIVNTTWDFGDGTTSSAQSPSHAYANSGTYYVCLVISTLNACSSSYCDSIQITVSGSCVADYSVNVTNATGSFSNLSTGGYSSVLWDFGDGTTSTQPNPSHNFPGLGTYTVCLTLFDSLGTFCDSTCQSVTVSTLPTCQAQFSVVPSVLQASFQDLSSGTGTPNAWTWDFGDGTTSNLQNPVHAYAAGTYIVCLTAEFTDGCMSTSCDTVTIFASGCTALWSTVVNGNDVDYTDLSTSFTGQPIVSWLWVLGGGASSFQQNPQHTFSGPGTWFTCLYITTADSCSASFCDSVITTGAVGIEENQLDNRARVWPNPANGEVNLSFIAPGSGQIQLRLTNVMGQVVWESLFSATPQQPTVFALDLRSEWQGLHWLQLIFPDQSREVLPLQIGLGDR